MQVHLQIMFALYTLEDFHLRFNFNERLKESGRLLELLLKLTLRELRLRLNIRTGSSSCRKESLLNHKIQGWSVTVQNRCLILQSNA